jgi:hypothetical protein
MKYDTPLLNAIFQEGHEIIEQFTFYNFTFLLVGIAREFDICSYSVSTGDFYIQLLIMGVDSTTPCRPCCNVDFIHFVWKHSKRFNMKKFAITLLPSASSQEPN